MEKWYSGKWDAVSLNQQELDIIDDYIFNERVVKTYVYLRKKTNLPLAKIFHFCHDRHQYLRQMHSDKFIRSIDDYDPIIHC